METFRWDKLDYPEERVTIKNVNVSELLENSPEYSDISTGSVWMQERLMQFGSSGHMFFIALLFLFNLLVSLIYAIYMWEWGIPIIIASILVGSSLLLITGIFFILIGSIQFKKEHILFGLSILNLIITIGFVFVLISATLLGVTIIISLFMSFAKTFFLALLLVFTYYLLIGFYKSILDFIRDCTKVFSSLSNQKVDKPNALAIRKYILILFYFSLAIILIAVFQYLEPIYLNGVVDYNPIFLLVFSIFNSSLLLYFVYLTTIFNMNIDYESYVNNPDNTSIFKSILKRLKIMLKQIG